MGFAVWREESSPFTSLPTGALWGGVGEQAWFCGGRAGLVLGWESRPRSGVGEQTWFWGKGAGLVLGLLPPCEAYPLWGSW